MIVTIDGPAGTGKSSAARGLAARLQFEFLDTGAMYRAAGWACLQQGVAPTDTDAAAQLAGNILIRFVDDGVTVNDEIVTDALRTPEVTDAASIVAQNPDVRAHLVRQQRQIAEGRDIVCEGRDQGTVVFPQAQCKFFLTADSRTRALRRQQELTSKGVTISLDELLAQQDERDRRDETRSVAPLRPADDAILVDTSPLDALAVLDLLESHVKDSSFRST